MCSQLHSCMFWKKMLAHFDEVSFSATSTHLLSIGSGGGGEAFEAKSTKESWFT